MSDASCMRPCTEFYAQQGSASCNALRLFPTLRSPRDLVTPVHVSKACAAAGASESLTRLVCVCASQTLIESEIVAEQLETDETIENRKASHASEGRSTSTPTTPN